MRNDKLFLYIDSIYKKIDKCETTILELKHDKSSYPILEELDKDNKILNKIPKMYFNRNINKNIKDKDKCYFSRYKPEKVYKINLGLFIPKKINVVWTGKVHTYIYDIYHPEYIADDENSKLRFWLYNGKIYWILQNKDIEEISAKNLMYSLFMYINDLIDYYLSDLDIQHFKLKEKNTKWTRKAKKARSKMK